LRRARECLETRARSSCLARATMDICGHWEDHHFSDFSAKKIAFFFKSSLRIIFVNNLQYFEFKRPIFTKS
jgi:hypothetical protein